MDGVEVAFAQVDFIAGDSILIKHTEVRLSHEGQGYGSALLQMLVRLARARSRAPVVEAASGRIVRQAANQRLEVGGEARYARTSRIRVISDGMPNRIGGPQ